MLGILWLNHQQKEFTGHNPQGTLGFRAVAGHPITWWIFQQDTLWLCQNSYGKWQFTEGFPMKNGDFHSHVKLPEGMFDDRRVSFSRSWYVLS